MAAIVTHFMSNANTGVGLKAKHRHRPRTTGTEYSNTGVIETHFM
jgi:hypothetical protein